MNKQILTQEYLKSRLSYNQVTGIFTWLIPPKRNNKIGSVAGYNFKGYVLLTIDCIQYRAHRLAFLYMTGSMPNCEIDHIDLDRGNNIWSNLREASQCENQRNVLKRKDNKTGYKGVSYRNNRNTWVAIATLNGKQKYIGSFITKEKASEAYNAFAKSNHGEFYRDSRLAMV